MYGCSCRQGPHQDAQKTSTVRVPRKSTVSAGPSRVVPESAGAANPVFPDGGAEATSCCSVQAESRSDDTNRIESRRPCLSSVTYLRAAILPGYRSSPGRRVVHERDRTDEQANGLSGTLTQPRQIIPDEPSVETTGSGSGRKPPDGMKHGLGFLGTNPFGNTLQHHHDERAVRSRRYTMAPSSAPTIPFQQAL